MFPKQHFLSHLFVGVDLHFWDQKKRTAENRVTQSLLMCLSLLYLTFKEGKGTSFKLKTHLNGMRKLREGGEITEPLSA